MKQYLYVMTMFLACLTACKTNTGDQQQVKRYAELALDRFKAHDATKLADSFTDDAQFINFTTKDSLSGAKDIADWCINTSGAEQISIDDIAMKDATHAFVTATIEAPIKIAIRAEFVKVNETWLIEQVRTINIEKGPSHYDELKELEWLVGTWINENDAVTMKVDNHWDANRNFLVQDFRVTIINQKEIQCTQVIGWNPARKKIRSWLFDSDGGYGRGLWFKKDNNWYVRVNYTLSDGSRGVSTNIYTKVDDDTYTFSSVGRDIDGELLPNIGPYTVHKARAA